MKLFKLSDYKKGWLVGDFEPSIMRTKAFEVTVRKYQKGDLEPEHVHKIASEITIITSGLFRMGDVSLREGDIIQKEPGESANFECLEDGWITVLKVPSVPGDKYLV